MAKWHDIVAYDEDLGSGLGGKNKTKQKKNPACASDGDVS